MSAASAFAQPAAPAASVSAGAAQVRTAVQPGEIDGSPAPIAPATVTRDDRQRATIRAIKLSAPLDLDGVLDEPVYTENEPFGGFIQVVPIFNGEATERTDVWVTYDDTNIYVSARVWDSAPPERWVSNELRRDTNQLRQNDHIAIAFDTFYDRRSGFMFYTNPLGALADYSVVDEGGSNTDWNPVWTNRTGRFDGGWTVEMSVPFKTLRYASGTNRMWGFQMRRSIRRKNEWTYLNPVPQNLAGPQALNRISSYGTLVGLDLPPASRNMEVKPYVLGRSTTDNVRVPPVSNDFERLFGGDFKYGINANLTADVTVNTDFAQVEVDEQQVNLTRFSLLLPEKRDFFLEGRGNFDFGRGNSGAGGNSGGTNDTPTLFYSRRIGLNRGRVIPIDVGGRVTGKAGKWGIGAVNIQGGDEDVSLTPSTNFTILRAKRDVLRRSSIGAIFTNRSVVDNQVGANQVYGLDAALAFYQNITAGAYWARSQTEDLTGQDRFSNDADSYQGRFDWSPDRYGVRAEYLKVGNNFRPEIGFLRRTNFEKASAGLRFSPRPRASRLVRKYTSELGIDYYVNGNGSVETRQQSARFNTEFHTSDQISIEATNNYEALFTRFSPGGGVFIPAGGYNFRDATLTYTAGQQRRFSGTLSVNAGEFYDGNIVAVNLGTARVAILKQFSIEPSFSINRIDLPGGEFTTKLFRSRADYGFSPRMFASALLQYSTSDNTFSSNVRFRWEYIPGSEFFLVWTDEHDTRANGTGLRNRAFVMKLTRLVRF
ncbi:MAG: carbohydrate binding family 9 domain-containing protein [Acidobacteria bacterium]|nr:carbohydrate binding family 9 domain-containing protein [Acidobacteriota bacterium]